MSPQELTNDAVGSLVAAINSGDRDEFLAVLAPDAVLTDDGKPQELTDWIDREIFTVHGRMTVDREEEQGLRLVGRYRNDTWGEMPVFWRFHVSGGKISRIDTGQA